MLKELRQVGRELKKTLAEALLMRDVFQRASERDGRNMTERILQFSIVKRRYEICEARTSYSHFSTTQLSLHIEACPGTRITISVETDNGDLFILEFVYWRKPEDRNRVILSTRLTEEIDTESGTVILRHLQRWLANIRLWLNGQERSSLPPWTIQREVPQLSPHDLDNGLWDF